MAFAGSDQASTGQASTGQASTDQASTDQASTGRAGTGEPAVPIAIKVLVAGGFGTGKTTLVGSVTEIRPLRTEEPLSEPGSHVDSLTGVRGKATTTVALDFGRITIRDDLVMYLFGTPGQERFWFMWDELATGALGAIVLADTRRLADCFPAVDYFEKRQIPFVLALNRFEGSKRHHPLAVRSAADVDPDVPVLECDARERESAKTVLLALIDHALARMDGGQHGQPQV